ncbi:MAG: hypothetical protein RLP02_29095 [Coleofasciculus sp. C2-GNP5-27]
MCDDPEALIAEACDLYESVVVGADSRIVGGNRLWEQFLSTADAVRAGKENGERQMRERINELGTAKYLADDPDIAGSILYEPNILASGRKIDFVVERDDERIYVEVKSVYPNTPDTQGTWERYLQLREHHPDNVNFIVEKDWLGGKIYGNTFASRSKFLSYSLAFEERLAEAREDVAGPGILVFCGSGFHWDVTDLEDFADFYHLAQHRADDPFSQMEQHEIDMNSVKLRRNIDHFAFLKRATCRAEITQVYFPVRGPLAGR